MDHYCCLSIDWFSYIEGALVLTLSLSQHPAKNLNYLVVGLGQSGFSVAEFFTQHDIQFSVQDDREEPPFLAAFKALNSGAQFINQALSSELMANYDSVVVSPGVSVQTAAFTGLAEAKTEVIGDIELFARFNTQPVVAITGSNGKTTVTSLLGAVLKACGYKAGVGGNIGTAALQLLDQQNDINVLELSSFQLETTYSLAPVVSVVLNVTEDHLDRYDNFEHYQQTKFSIHRYSGLMVINRDDKNSYSEDSGPEEDVEYITFGLGEADYEDDFGVKEINGDYWLCQGDLVLINSADLKIKGKHNWANCLAVLAMADALNLDLVKTIAAMTKFEGIEHRYETVTIDNNEVTWINDSKATNPGATIAAIEGTFKPTVLIAGGQSKQADMSVLNHAIKHHIKALILLGEDAALLEAEWAGLTQTVRVENMQQAVAKASELSTKGDCVMLSPACASLDLYSNYMQRGDDFKACVKQQVGAHE